VTAVRWHEGRMVALDTETTGTNPLEARIVTAAVVHIAPDQRPSTISWVIDPGMPVPDEAAAVHGWTTERVAAHIGRRGQGRLAVRLHNGRAQTLTADAALFEIAAQAATAMAAEAPLVVMNAAYDLSLLEAECARNDVPTLSSRPTGIRGVVDPMVLERQFDPYRKVKGGCRGGKYDCGGCGAEDKTLTSLCLHYGVRHGGAHDASADAVAAVRILSRIVGAWPDIARLKLGTLHQHQIGWRRAQADSLRAFFDRTGVEHDGIDGGWPVHSSLIQASAVA
jgi:DNA polymerase III subunit epsilon